LKTVIVAAKRTPIGTFLGSFAGFSAVDLGVAVTKAVISNLPHTDVADVVVGNVLQAALGMNVAADRRSCRVAERYSRPDRQSRLR
jgi:acetyl-CoA C-acetyltransferase